MKSLAMVVYESDIETVWRVTGPYLGSHHYLVLNHTKQATFIVDSGFGPTSIVDLARYLGREVVGLYLTHGHFDHAGGAKFISEELNCPVLMNVNDKRTLNSSNFLLKVFGYSERMEIPIIESYNSYQDEFVSILECPGHTPGSVLVKSTNSVFTGDSVYADRIDAVKLPQQDDRELRLSIKKHIDLLTSDVQIFPGHGSTVNGNDLLNQNKELFSFLESVGAAGE